MTRVYIVAARRTPFGRFRGKLSGKSPVELASTASISTLEGIDRSSVDQIILGNVLSAGHGMNIARQVAVNIGLPITAPAYTINMMCGSGMQAALLGAQAIRCGDAHVVLVGGVESMSQSAMLMKRVGKGQSLSLENAVDSMQTDGLVDSFSHRHMAETAEDLARECKISRHEQDAWAERSQSLYARASALGYFVDEIDPVEDCQQDEHPRPEVDQASLAVLKPIFDPTGSVTAGNSSGINDGAAMLLLADGSAVKKHGWTILAELTAGTSIGCDPGRMGLGPVHAIRKLLSMMGSTLQDFDHLEINEAFAAQTLACLKQLEVQVDFSRADVSTGIASGSPLEINAHGGAIAIGHPLAASGARLLVHLAWQIARGRSKKSLASLCIGGGMGIATSLSEAIL